MIFYSNSSIDLPHLTFIGRWSPFHIGHSTMIQKKMLEKPDIPLLILVRSTATDAYPPVVRAQFIKNWMIEHSIRGTIMIVPNIEGIYWGRGVGYVVEQVDVEEEMKKISGTSIRKQIADGALDWKKHLAHSQSAHLLAPAYTQILESGHVVWLTGCPSSGKTTIANKFISTLHAQYPFMKIQLLDGDQVRNTPLAANIGFSAKDRAEHIRRMGHIAKILADNAVFVVCAFVSPDRHVRSEVKKIVGAYRFKEIYIKSSKKNRIARDTKGLYKKAANGEISNLTGFNAPYQRPLKPFMVCDTDVSTIQYIVNSIMIKIFSGEV